MESAHHPYFKIELMPNDIIFVERRGEQAEAQLKVGFERVRLLAAQLRLQGKPVLILNHATTQNVSPRVIAYLQQIDFDRVAVYGASTRDNSKRNLMVSANALEQKIASFPSEAEALAWLLDF